MKRIAELRHEKHITQTALAMKLNITQNMISFYESGKYQPSIDTLIELAKVFDVSVDYLIGNTDIRYPADKLIQDKSTVTEIEMITLFKSLTKDEQQRAIGIIQATKHSVT